MLIKNAHYAFIISVTTHRHFVNGERTVAVTEKIGVKIAGKFSKSFFVCPAKTLAVQKCLLIKFF